VISDSRRAAALRGSARDRDALAHNIMVTHHQPGVFAHEADVLRFRGDRAEGEKTVVAADTSGTVNGYVRDQFATVAEFDLRPNHAIRANFAGRSDACSRVDDCGGMNKCFGIGQRVLKTCRTHSMF